MIVDLPSTSTGAVARALVDLRERGNAVALGRVLTLAILAEEGDEEEAILAANEASREHPCRVLALVAGNRDAGSRLDAQIRTGGDAGASEVIVLRTYGPLADQQETLVTPLLLPDAPVVAWWPTQAPEDPARSPVGRMAQRRITDAMTGPAARTLGSMAAHYADGDTDLTWTRLTKWREQLAAILDQPPYEPVTAIEVSGESGAPSVGLLGTWLGIMLDAPVTVTDWPGGRGVCAVRLTRAGGVTELVRPGEETATLNQPGQPARPLALPHRTLAECLAEELRRLDPDVVFGEILAESCTVVQTQPATTGAAS